VLLRNSHFVGKKIKIPREQNGVVATRQQSKKKCDPALPRSNQILATMFD
jgi:hypothetical protein